MANIYLHIEIKKREFEAKFFTGLKAALRGHRVLVGYLLPLLRNDLLAPGIFHDKALTPRPKKIASMKAARAAGHHYTSIDEEHGLLRESYELFANLRYSAETIEQASAVMFWGPHDFNYMKKAYPQFAHKFHMTGNPRADLWRAEFAPVFDVQLPVKKPYVLFVSNLGSVFGKTPLDEFISQMRNGYFKGPEDELEFWFYKWASAGALMGAEYVRAIRRLALTYPETAIVVRPHPTERPEAWQRLIGNYKNVVIQHEGSIAPVLRGATVMIHNGCTTSMEATKGGIPVLTYAPIDTHNEEHFFPNQLGGHVGSIEQLVTEVGKYTTGAASRESVADDFKLLSQRLTDTGSETAADTMLAVWESLAADAKLQSGSFWRGGRLPRFKSFESFYDVYRYARHLPYKTLGIEKLPSYPNKFEAVSQSEVDDLKARFTRFDPAFSKVRVKRIGPRVVSFET